ncbi:MAG: hypothetical protein ABI439_00495 [Rhodospirillales bacterium]
MTAAERAIVRVTHHIEKLEERLSGDQRGDQRGETRRSSSELRPSSRFERNIMGRLFEG